MELLVALLDDHRIQVLFTINGDPSAYETGAIAEIAKLGGRLVPWGQAVTTEFDLAIAASQYGSLHELQCPLLIVPHGPGYTKVTSMGRGEPAPVPILASGGQALVVRTLTHGDQVGQFGEVCDGGISYAVMGDPCFDRLRASQMDRHIYRHDLGVGPGQHLVTVTSTWGPEALFAEWPEIIETLVGELPIDTYVIAAILHPNIWVGHGAWQVRQWLRRPIDAGLRLVPYMEGWRATLVASDSVIGDHGSVTFYAASLGIPVVLATFADDEVVASTPLAQLGNRAPRLTRGVSLRDQLERVGFEIEPHRYADLVQRSFAAQGQATENLRNLVYELLDFDPVSSAIPKLAVPRVELKHCVPTSIVALVGGHRGDDYCPPPSDDLDIRHMDVSLFAATVDAPNTHGVSGRVLIAREDESDFRLRECASAIIGVRSDRGSVLDESRVESHRSDVQRILVDYPGSALAMAPIGPKTWQFRFRSGARGELSIEGLVGPTGIFAVAGGFYWSMEVLGDRCSSLIVDSGPNRFAISVNIIDG